MKNNKWLWKAEKFRNANLDRQEVGDENPVPMLMEAKDVEEMRKLADDFNARFKWSVEIMGVHPICDEAIQFHGLTRLPFPLEYLSHNKDWSNSVRISIYLPGGTYGEFIEIPQHQQFKKTQPAGDKSALQ
jgi:hypothetical protein